MFNRNSTPEPHTEDQSRVSCVSLRDRSNTIAEHKASAYMYVLVVEARLSITNSLELDCTTYIKAIESNFTDKDAIKSQKTIYLYV